MLFGKIIESIKNNYYVNNGIEVIRNNRIVNQSYQAYNIAREVYVLVQEEKEESPQNLEDQYLRASHQITYIPTDLIRERLDFQLVQRSASTGRKIKKLTKKVSESILREYEEIKQKILSLFIDLRNKCKQMISLAVSKIEEFLKGSPDRLKKLIQKLKEFADSFYKINLFFLKQMTEKLRLEDLISYSLAQLQKLKQFVLCGTQRFCSNVRRNKESLKKVILFNIENFKLLFQHNTKIIENLLDVNEKVIHQYFQDLDIEIYCGRDPPSKPLAYLRNVYDRIMNEGNINIEQIQDSQEDTMTGE